MLEEPYWIQPVPVGRAAAADSCCGLPASSSSASQCTCAWSWSFHAMWLMVSQKKRPQFSGKGRKSEPRWKTMKSHPECFCSTAEQKDLRVTILPYGLKGSPRDWNRRLDTMVWISPQKKAASYWRSPKWPNSNAQSRIQKLCKNVEILLKIYKKTCFYRLLIVNWCNYTE